MGVESVRLGPCRVFLNNIDLGLTSGGVEITISTQNTQTEIDHFGYRETIDIITQRLVSVKMSLAETNLGVYSSTLAANGASYSSLNNVVTIALDQSIGLDITKNTRPLFIQSLDPATGYELDIVIPRAVQTGDFSFAFKVDNLRVFDVTFTGYPDGDNKVLYASEKSYNPNNSTALNSLTVNSDAISNNGVQLTF